CATARSRSTPAPTDAGHRHGASRRDHAGLRRRARARGRGRALAAGRAHDCGRAAFRSVGGVVGRQRRTGHAGGAGATRRRRGRHRRSPWAGRPAPRLPALPHPGIRAGMTSAPHFRRTVPMRLSPRLPLLLLPLLLAACAGGGGTRAPADTGALLAPADAAAPTTAPAADALGPEPAPAASTVALADSPGASA